MSMHKIELTALERTGLEVHRLPIGKPSQLSDCFRHGIEYALSYTSNTYEKQQREINWQMDKIRKLKEALLDVVDGLSASDLHYGEGLSLERAEQILELAGVGANE